MKYLAKVLQDQARWIWSSAMVSLSREPECVPVKIHRWNLILLRFRKIDKATWWCLRIFMSRICYFCHNVCTVSLWWFREAPQSATDILDYMFFLPNSCLGPIITGPRNTFSQLTLGFPIISESNGVYSETACFCLSRICFCLVG